VNTEFSAVFPVGVNSISGHSLDREPKQALWQRYAVSSVLPRRKLQRRGVRGRKSRQPTISRDKRKYKKPTNLQ